MLKDDGIPSVSIAHIRNGKVVLVAAYGEQRNGVPATSATLYNAASLTKPLTAEVILRLASKGESSLDEPMDRYWLESDIAITATRLSCPYWSAFVVVRRYFVS